MSETDLGLTSRYKSMLSLMYATKRYAVDERTCPYLVDDCQWTHLGIAEWITEEARVRGRARPLARRAVGRVKRLRSLQGRRRDRCAGHTRDVRAKDSCVSVL